MTTDDTSAAALRTAAIDIVIRLCLLGLIGYWALSVISPFLTIVLWSAILTVALYPIFDWLAQRLGSRRLAAALVTLSCLLIVIGPVAWLAIGLIDGIDLLAKKYDAGLLSLPKLAETAQGWPLIGDYISQLWTYASTNVKTVVVEILPKLKPVGSKLIEIAAGAGFGLLELGAAIVIAGFMFSPGPQLVNAIRLLLNRLLSRGSEETLQMIGATIRNVSRGVVGVAVVQSFLAGIGFVIAGIPAAGFFAFLALLLSIVQVGAAVVLIPIVIWSWIAMETTYAIIFTAYMIPVSLIDNVLRPMAMAHGLATPMLVIMIGVIGGTITHGIIGLFLGPVILSVAWNLVVAWVTLEQDAERSVV